MQIKQNVQIIHISKSMESMVKHITVRIIRDVRISEGQRLYCTLLVEVKDWPELQAGWDRIYNLLVEVKDWPELQAGEWQDEIGETELSEEPRG